MVMKSSPRPKANPKRPVSKSPRPKANPLSDSMSPKSIEERSLRSMAKGGKISEYGGKETYKSKAAMKKHEAKESPAKERKESRMATGGMCRGMGAATKGGKFTRNG